MEIQAQNPHLSVLSQNLQDYAFLLLDLDGHIVRWSPEAERILGYCESEVSGKHFSLLKYQSCEQDKSQPEPVAGDAAYECRRIRKDGSSFWAKVIITSLHDENDRLTGFVKIVQDITERKRAEDRLAHLAAIVESSKDAIITTDRQGTIESWNLGARDLYGYPASEMLGKSILQVVPNIDPLSVFEHLNDLSNFESTFLTECGSLKTISITVSRLPDLMHSAGAISWICRDVTSHKIILDKVTQSNKDLEQFAYVASHDLQEPVRAVIGCLQLFEESITDNLSDRSRMFLSEAGKAALRMHALTNDLLSYARIQNRAPNIQTTDLSAVLNDVVQSLETQIKDNDIQITCEQLPLVEVDRSQLRHVLQNLVENAIKYRSENRLEIRLSAEEQPGHCVYCVSDNGIGFDMQFERRIFEIFQRLHSRSRYPGTGIGLAICRRIIERHHGRMWAESVPCEGSKFYFSLPVKQRG